MSEPPKVIFLDAVGTLFGVRGSVGEIYREIARQFGVEVSATVLNQSFIQSFRAMGLPAFPGVAPAEISNREFEWWQAIATQTFERAGVFHQFRNFSIFFVELYSHFATAAPWVVYPDVQPMLQRWQQQGIELGVLSNFDSRLYAVLQDLELTDFFTSITLSTEAGVAKPNREIFAIALSKHNCAPHQAWHVGDSFTEDYQAAKAAGLRGIWLKRVVDESGIR